MTAQSITAQEAAPATRITPLQGLRRFLGTVSLDMLAPIAVFYVMTNAGASDYVALLVGAIMPALGITIKLVRERHLDGLGMFVMVLMLASVAISFITGSTRFLLAKDGWGTGLAAVWFLASLRAERPFVFVASRPFMEGVVGGGWDWDELWQRLPKFRRLWRVATVVWGVALLTDATGRIIMSYALPINEVPALGGLLFLVLLITLQVINNGYFLYAGLFRRNSKLYLPMRNAALT